MIPVGQPVLVDDNSQSGVPLTCYHHSFEVRVEFDDASDSWNLIERLFEGGANVVECAFCPRTNRGFHDLHPLVEGRQNGEARNLVSSVLPGAKRDDSHSRPLCFWFSIHGLSPCDCAKWNTTVQLVNVNDLPINRCSSHFL